MSEMTKKPDIRFSGFTDAWEQCEFGKAFNHLQNNSFSRAQLSYENGEVMNIHYGDILVEFGECLDISQNVMPRIINSDFGDKYRTSYIENGDVIIADAAEDETVGKCCEIRGLQGQKILSGLHTIPCRPIKKFATGYLGYYMNSDAYHDQLLPLMQGTKVSSISKTALTNTYISYPRSIEEQEKIGTYFIELDNLITLHQHKYDKLIILKKAMLEKMFPKEGNSVPEIRFSGFTDAWEQCKLGELMDITSVKRIHQSDWTTSGVRFLRARDIVSESKGEMPADYLYIAEDKYNEYSALSGKVKVGDLLVTGVGTIGVPMLINSEVPVYFKDGNVIWFKNENRINGLFFYYSFIGNTIQSFIKESAGIGTVGTYTIDSGKKTPIMLPKKNDEQQRIGDFFKNLDNLITLHQHKLDKFKNIKKSLLEKMFI